MSKIQAHARRGNHPDPAVETLEDRRLMSVTLGANLLVNPGAEANIGVSDKAHIVAPAGWTNNGAATAVKYGATGGFPTAQSPGPASRGNNFFAGGPTAGSDDLFQNVNLTSIASSIDAGKITFSLSGFLGGINNQADDASVFVNFHDGSGAFISQVNIGPVSAAQRGNVTSLLFRSLTGTIPEGTRSAQVQIHFDYNAGTYNDAYADNLSFVANGPKVTTGTVSGGVFRDSNGNGKPDIGEKGIAGLHVFVDGNNNGKLDPTETFTTTNPAGGFTLAVKPGIHTIRVSVPPGFRQTVPGPSGYVVNVQAGKTISGEIFGLKSILVGL